MKLSNFLIEKKIIFDGGEIPKITSPSLEGEITIHNLTKDRIELMNKEVIQKFKGKESDEMLTYKLFPYITDLEVDVSFEVFQDMLSLPPSNAFAVLLDAVIDSMNDLFKKAETVTNSNNKAKEMMKNEMAVPKEKTKEEIKIELENELMTLKENTPENKTRRKEIYGLLADCEE